MQIKPGIISVDKDALELNTNYIQGPLLKHLQKLTQLLEGREADFHQLEGCVGMLITSLLTYTHAALGSSTHVETYMVDFLQRLMVIHKKVELDKNKK